MRAVICWLLFVAGACLVSLAPGTLSSARAAGTGKLQFYTYIKDATYRSNILPAGEVLSCDIDANYLPITDIGTPQRQTINITLPPELVLTGSWKDGDIQVTTSGQEVEIVRPSSNQSGLSLILYLMLRRRAELPATPPVLTITGRAQFSGPRGSGSASGSTTLVALYGSLDVRADRSGPVKAGDRIRYTATYDYPHGTFLDGSAYFPFPQGTRYVPGSFSGAAGGSVFIGSGIAVTWSGGARAPKSLSVSYQVEVSAEDVERLKLTEIKHTGSRYSFRVGYENYQYPVKPGGFRTVLYSAPGKDLVHPVQVGPGVRVTLRAQTARAGEVKSGELVTYLVDAEADEPANLTLTATVPPNTELIPASIKPAGTAADRKITWTFTNVTRAAAEFRVKVLKQGPRILFVNNRAEARAAFAGGKTATDAKDLALRYLRDALEVEAVAQVPGNAPGVVTGGRIDYTLFAATSRKASRLVLRASVPPGTELIPGTVSPAAGSGPNFTWTFLDVDTAPTVRFAVKLLEKAKRPDGLKRVTLGLQGDATFAGGETARATATAVTPILAPGVQGVVSDVILDFPNRTFVDDKTPLPGVKARLLDAKGAEVDAAETDREGRYELEAPSPGPYTVEFKAKAARYDSTADRVQPSAWDVKQVRKVTVLAPGDPKGTPSGVVELDLNLPVSLVNGLAKRLLSLNRLDIPIQGGVALPWDEDWIRDLLHLRYNTTAAERLLARVMDEAPEFPGVYKGGRERDYWNALIRLDVTLTMMRIRYDEVAVLADDAGKTLALAFCVELLKNLGKRTQFWRDRAGASEHLTRVWRIGSFAYVINPVLDAVLAETDLKPRQKAFVKEFVFKVARFGTSKMAGKVKDDVTFEIVFLLLRHAVVAAALELHVNGLPGDDSPGYQALLDDAVALAERRVYASDTTATLAYVERLNGQLGDEFLEVHNAAVDALRKISYIRGANGIWAEYKKYRFKTGREVDSSTFGKLMAFVEKPVTAATYTAYSVAAGLPLALIWQRGGQMQAVTAGAFSGPVDGSRVAARTASFLPAAKSLRERLAAEDAGHGRASAAARSSRRVAAYMKSLRELEKLLKRGKPQTVRRKALALLRPGIALFDGYLEPLGARSELLLPQLTPAQAEAALAFLDARYEAANQHAILYTLLAAWAADPDRAVLAQLRKKLGETRGAVSRAGSLALPAERALAGKRAPGALYLFGGELPAWPRGGQEVTLTFTVQNIGDQPLVAGTAGFFPAGNLALLDAAEKPLPALAPGATARVSWRVRTPAAPEGDDADYWVRAAAGGSRPAELQESLLVLPGP